MFVTERRKHNTELKMEDEFVGVKTSVLLLFYVHVTFAKYALMISKHDRL